MRIGFAPAGQRDGATAVRMAQRAEDAGFSEIWLSEDYLERGAFALAGGIAAATSEAQVGIGVINPWTRHVALTAMEAAAADELSQGRLILGLGASNERWMTGLLGIPFVKPITRMEQYARALRVLLRGEHLAAEIGGQHIDARLSFQPFRPDLPIYFGVKGPRALRIASDLGDGLMLSVLSPPEYISWIRTEYAPSRLTAYVTLSVDDDPAQARDRIRQRTAKYLGMHGASPITALGGLSAQRAEELRHRLLQGREGADLVDDETLSAFSVAGSAAYCGQRLLRYAEAGLDTLIVMDDGVRPPDLVLRDAIAVARDAGLIGGSLS